LIASKLNSDVELTFIAICNTFKDSAWKTRYNTNGEEWFGGRYFIAGIQTDNGVCTHIFHMKHWDSFKCKEIERLPDFGEYYYDDMSR
jgi:hypothetical protein